VNYLTYLKLCGRSGPIAVADRVLRVARCRLRVRHLAGRRRVTVDTALPVGSTTDHCTYVRR